MLLPIESLCDFRLVYNNYNLIISCTVFQLSRSIGQIIAFDKGGLCFMHFLGNVCEYRLKITYCQN